MAADWSRDDGCFRCGEPCLPYDYCPEHTVAAMAALANRLRTAETALARVVALCDDYDSNGNAAALGDPCASVWHKVARQVRAVAQRAGRVTA